MNKEHTLLLYFAINCLDNVGLGGGLDGYAIEHGSHCLTSALDNYIMTKEITSAADIGLTNEYLAAFGPNGYIKFWVR